MNIINNNNSNTIIINKSKFIGFIYKIENKEEIDNILNNLKKEYKDATHICYAYRLTNTEKCFDDKEPSGSAGYPMLSILKEYDLVSTLCVVVRFFGGIKLGVGGLIRAYKNTINDLIKITGIKEYKKFTTVYLESSFKDEKILNNICKDLEIISKEYSDKIIIKAKVYDIETIKKTVENTNIKMNQD